MKTIFLSVLAALFLFYSCSQKAITYEETLEVEDSLTNRKQELPKLFAVLQMKDTIHTSDSLKLTFTVYNKSDNVQKFCKWHTPFEPLISKYLQIIDEGGNEVNYIGAMAKRIMPPPAESYLTVASKDSLATTVDLLKGYDLTKKGNYTVKYTGENMSGLSVKGSISFLYH